MAQAETQSFIQAIVNDLLAQGNRQGFCYLFGLDQAQAPCVSPCAAKANTQNVSSEALSITTPPFVTTTSPISLQAAGATNELDLECVSLTALMNAAGPVPVGFSGKVNPTPYTAGSYALLGYLPGYPNQPSVTVLTYGDSANPYDTQLFSVGTPNVVTVQTITHICSDDVAKTELDQFTGTINIGLLYELQPTSYTGLSLTGSFNSTAYLCQKGATAVGTPPASGTVVLAQTFRCQ
jgi:hypothetical protein